MLKWYEKIKILRKRNGWSQTELAQRVGYTDKSMISKIEKGSVDIPRSQVIKFADAFNITASELIGEAVAELSADLDDLERVILSNFRKLSPHDKKAVSIMIQTMADNTEPSAPAADLDKTIEEKQTIVAEAPEVWYIADTPKGPKKMRLLAPKATLVELGKEPAHNAFKLKEVTLPNSVKVDGVKAARTTLKAGSLTIKRGKIAKKKG